MPKLTPKERAEWEALNAKINRIIGMTEGRATVPDALGISAEIGKVLKEMVRLVLEE